MNWKHLDLSARGRARVWLVTIAGTVFCIGVALFVDLFSFEDLRFETAGRKIVNDILIPLLLAPPFFWLLMSKLRELAIAYRELSIFASTDSLTACLNRKAFVALVEAHLLEAAQLPGPRFSAMLVVDADHFKRINDTFGHENGDEALKLIATNIKGAIRKTDFVGRIGGEEFCVFMPGCDQATASDVAERIRTAVRSAPFQPDGRARHLSVSVGGAVADGAIDFSALFRTADERLYLAKGKGRNRVELAQLTRPPGTAAAATALH